MLSLKITGLIIFYLTRLMNVKANKELSLTISKQMISSSAAIQGFSLLRPCGEIKKSTYSQYRKCMSAHFYVTPKLQQLNPHDAEAGILTWVKMGGRHVLSLLHNNAPKKCQPLTAVFISVRTHHHGQAHRFTSYDFCL